MKKTVRRNTEKKIERKEAESMKYANSLSTRCTGTNIP